MRPQKLPHPLQHRQRTNQHQLSCCRTSSLSAMCWQGSCSTNSSSESGCTSSWGLLSGSCSVRRAPSLPRQTALAGWRCKTLQQQPTAVMIHCSAAALRHLSSSCSGCWCTAGVSCSKPPAAASVTWQGVSTGAHIGGSCETGWPMLMHTAALGWVGA